MDASPQVSLHRQTCVDAPGRLKSTSQAEYAGSIPVIGSTVFVGAQWGLIGAVDHLAGRVLGT
jgi:hypothetical protein